MSSINILPMNKHEGDRKHWVVRWLRYNGYIICTACLIFGYGVGAFYAAPIAISAGMPKAVAVPLLTLISGLLSFVIGLGISLPFWGMSMMIDDLHALRIYASGYVTVGDKNIID